MKCDGWLNKNPCRNPLESPARDFFEWMEVGRTDQVEGIFDGSRNVVRRTGGDEHHDDGEKRPPYCRWSVDGRA